MLEKTARFSYMFLFFSGMFQLFYVNNVQAAPDSSYPKLGCFTWGLGASPAWCAQFDMLISADQTLAIAAKKLNPNMYALVTRDWQCAHGLSNIPDNWYVRNSEGVIITIYNSDDYKLVDITDYCPTSAAFGGKRYNEYLTDWMTNVADLSVLDGVSCAGVVEQPRSGALTDVDLDRNNVNDWEEHGKQWIIDTWEAGIHTATALLRAEIGDDKLIHFNSSRLHDFERETTNGVYLEHQEYNTSFSYYRTQFTNWMSVAPEPHILHYGANRAPAINDYRYVRFHLAQALFGDAYFEATNAWSGEHHWISYYDEFNLDLGQPVSSMYLLKSTSTWDGVWIRFFEKGLILLSATSDAVTVTASEIASQSYYNGPYYHFKGGQDITTNDGTQFDTFTFQGRSWTSSGYIGDGLVLVNSYPVVAISDIVVDNGYPTTSPGSSSAELSNGAYETSTETSGHWSSGAWTGTAANVAQKQYHSAVIPQGTTSAKAIFRPTINVSGMYDVYEWHGSLLSGTEVENVNTRIGFGADLEAETSIDQSINSGKWNSLGTYYFNKTGDNYVELDQSADGIVIADAVKFVYIGAEDDVVPPNPPLQLKSDSQTETTIQLSWSAPAAASDGDLAVAYQVIRNGTLVTTITGLTFLDEGLVESTTYSYTVYSVDDFGLLSTQAAALQVATKADNTAPEFISVIVRSTTELELVFSEDLEETSAETPSYYSINNDITISSATLLENANRVQIKTSEHQVGTSYEITASNIKDNSKLHNIMTASKTIGYSGATGDSILIKISADNQYDLYVNGIYVDTDAAWSISKTYWVASVAGKNVIAVKGIDLGGQAGLVAEIDYKGQHIVSNSTSWKVSKEEKVGWETNAYDDSDWSYATSWGAHGIALPWATYKNVTNISTTSDVQWIWSDDYELDDIVYFRLNLNQSGDTTPPATPSGFSEVIQVK